MKGFSSMKREGELEAKNLRPRTTFKCLAQRNGHRRDLEDYLLLVSYV